MLIIGKKLESLQDKIKFIILQPNGRINKLVAEQGSPSPYCSERET